MSCPVVEIIGADGHVRSLDDIEADIIRLALYLSGGKRRAAAERLKIGRATLYRRLNELGPSRQLDVKW